MAQWLQTLFCLCVYHLHAWYLKRPEAGVRSSGTRIASHHVGAGDLTRVLWQSISPDPVYLV